MGEKRNSKRGLKGAVLGFFLAIMIMLGGVIGVTSGEAYAVPGDTTTTTTTGTTSTTGTSTTTGTATTETTATDESGAATEETEESDKEEEATEDKCQSALGSIGWIVCPTTGKVAEAVDWLYDMIEKFLVVKPIEAKDGTPIYEIWKYCRGVTNVVFIIFLLVVIYSQLTGLGISNYGIKKALPKLIVVAVLVNLSFIICSLAVDVSNVIGSSLRGVFETVQESAVAGMVADGGMSATDLKMSQAGMYSALAGGTALMIGGAVIAFETGAIWMLIPVILGALVAVVTGLATIAMRQAVVALLIMISPLAFVAYMLPNTESWFKKWKELLFKMLVFYPMFSVLFGASQLAGFAIVASATDGFGVLLGVAVQIFPLFFSWKLMKMSGTVLGTINEGMHKLASAPLATNRAWADSHRQQTKANYLASEKARTPSLYLRQFLANRRIEREAETSEKNEMIKNRGLAYRARRNYDSKGLPTRRGEEAYEDVARNLEYQRAIARDKNNLNKGLGQLEVSKKYASEAQKRRLAELDTRVVNASDFLKVEQARGEKIEYENAKGFHNRMEAAINAHMDDTNGYIVDANGVRLRNAKYKLHLEPGSDKYKVAIDRYSEISGIMEGNVVDAQFAAAKAATTYDTQKKIIENAYQKYFELTPPTRDVEYRLGELTTMKNAADYIDTIIPGLRILNQRGDTDLVGIQLDNVLTGGKNGKVLADLKGKIQKIKADKSLTSEEINKQIKELYENAGLDEKAVDGYQGVQLGTHASQALASFLMFDVKDNDPFLRRFGKYINLETANVFNANKRKEVDVTMEEYIKGYHMEPDGSIMTAKKPMIKLLEGTSLDNPERTFYSNMDESIMMAYGWDKDNPDKEWDVKGWLAKRKEVFAAIMPQFISANLKYLSGSEQIASAVKSLTGYGSEPIKNENGEVVDSTLSEPIWKKSYFKGHEDEVKKAFQDTVKSYIESQTPTQVSGLRTDYRRALAQHLSEEMLGLDDSKLSPEGITARNEYAAELAEIQTRYGDLPAEEAAKKRAEDERALREKIGGDEFLRLLDARGKLKHIYTSKRYGAGNMKDWERTWLKLDDDDAITDYIKKKRQEIRKKSQQDKEKNDTVMTETEGVQSVFDEAFKNNLVNNLQDMYDSPDVGEDLDGSMFYEDSLEYLSKNLPSDSLVIAKYKKFRKEYPNPDRRDYFEELKKLIDDDL